MNYCCCNDKDMEELMRVKPVVTLSWEESFRNSTCIDESSRDVQDAHEKETTERILQADRKDKFVMRGH
jgi:hypothetical protein